MISITSITKTEPKAFHNGRMRGSGRGFGWETYKDSLFLKWIQEMPVTSLVTCCELALSIMERNVKKINILYFSEYQFIGLNNRFIWVFD